MSVLVQPETKATIYVAAIATYGICNKDYRFNILSGQLKGEIWAKM